MNQANKVQWLRGLGLDHTKLSIVYTKHYIIVVASALQASISRNMLVSEALNQGMCDLFNLYIHL